MPNPNGRPGVLDRIGGPNSVTWPGFWILFVVGSLVSTASAASTGSGPAWIGIVVSVSAATVVYSVLALARVTVLRRVAERPRPWRTLACFFLATLVGIVLASVIGGILSAATGATPGSGTPPDPVTVLVSIGGTLVGAVLVLSVAAVVVDAWREYRTAARELQALDGQLEQLHSTTAAELDAQDARIRAEVEKLLLSEIDALGASDTSGAAARLRRAAIDVVRPLSHDLGLGFTAMPEPSPAEFVLDAGQVVRDATAHRLFAPWVSATVITVPVLFTALLSGGGAYAMVYSAFTFIEVALLAWVANAAFSPRCDRASVKARLGWLLVSTSLITLVVLVTWLLLDSSSDTGVAWVVLIWIVPVILLLPASIAAVGGVRARQDRTLAALQDDVAWQVARSRELVWARQTTLARALHGPVQSAVLAASLRLDASARAGDVAPLAIEEARASLLDILAAFAASPDEAADLPETFSRLQEMWAGVSDITVEADSAVLDLLARDRVCARAVADVVTEGCSNAVRHGKATAILIRLEVQAPSRLQVFLSDNGQALPDGELGLGSRLLDAVSIDWDREPTPHGTILTVLLPVQAPVG